MRNEIEDLINERLEALDEIDVVDSNNVNTVISSKVNEQNNKVEFSRKKQEKNSLPKHRKKSFILYI